MLLEEESQKYWQDVLAEIWKCTWAGGGLGKMGAKYLVKTKIYPTCHWPEKCNKLSLKIALKNPWNEAGLPQDELRTDVCLSATTFQELLREPRDTFHPPSTTHCFQFPAWSDLMERNRAQNRKTHGIQIPFNDRKSQTEINLILLTANQNQGRAQVGGGEPHDLNLPDNGHWVWFRKLHFRPSLFGPKTNELWCGQTKKEVISFLWAPNPFGLVWGTEPRECLLVNGAYKSFQPLDPSSCVAWKFSCRNQAHCY